MKRGYVAILICFSLCTGFANAGGPLNVVGPASANAGQTFIWNNSAPIPYTVDTGPLSTDPNGQVVINNSQGLARVQSLFQNWSSVSTASIAYTYAGPISAPGLAAGADVKTVQDFNAVVGACNAGTQNPVIFDADGSLLRALGFDPLVIGFSGHCSLNLTTGRIVSALVFLNGQFQDGVTNSSQSNYELTADQFDEAITHELGHFSGLGHSQINLDLYQSGAAGNCNVDELAGLPLMFPVAFCQSRKSAGLPILSPDDTAWISKLYPNAATAANYGTISGFVFFSDGITHVQGVNVIARRMDDPSTPEDESKRIAFSAVSGYQFTGNPGQSISGDNTGGSSFGSRNPALIGYYEIPVPPGTYTVQVENIDAAFTAGSSLGPLDPPAVTTGASEFWHQFESAFDDPARKDTLTVSAGQKLSNINIILNGTSPRFDQFEDGEVRLLRPELDFAVRAFRRLRLYGKSS